ncbi:MAG: hypothetical protein ACRYGP_33405 [Janthinobacterium lividum]
MARIEDTPDALAQRADETAEHVEAVGPRVTRRAFVAGSGGVVAAAGLNPAAALTPSTEFGIIVSTEGFRVRFRNERCIEPVEVWVPRSYWSPTDLDADKAIFDVIRSKAQVGPDLETRRSIRIMVDGARFAGSPPFTAALEFRLVGTDCTVNLTTKGWPRPGINVFRRVDFLDFVDGKPLTIPISKTETVSLIRSLFGDRIGCSTGGELGLGPDLVWTLTPSGTDALTTVVDLASNAKATNVSFSALSFAPSTPGAEPFDEDVHARAFPGEGEPASPGSGARVVSSAVTGWGSGARVRRPIALGRVGSLDVSATVATADDLAFQQFGDPTRTLSGFRGSFSVDLGVDGTREGPFLTQSGWICRYGPSGMDGLVRLPLCDKPFKVESRNGGFVVEAADASIKAPGADRSVPGILLSTRSGTIVAFEVVALLRQAFIPFPASFAGPLRPFFSRLDFAGADCRFVLDALQPASGRSSSGSTIHLGAAGGRPATAEAPVRIGLDQATLRVVRPDDLLSLTFRFSGIALIGVGTGARIVPMADPSCGMRLAGVLNADMTSQSSRVAAFRPGAAVDSRPVMVVEFPPQHVAERAFRRQVDDGEDPPDVALPDELVGGLREAFASLDAHRRGCAVDPSRLMEARNDVSNAKRCAAQTGAFERFATTFAIRFKERAVTSGWPDEQGIYIGSGWLDPDVRRLARQVAAELSRSKDGVATLGAPAAVPTPVAPTDLMNPDGPASDRDALASALDLLDPFPEDRAVEARLSGPSRLAFRINCDDVDGQGGAFDFTLERLTDWSRFDLSVVRRAEKLLDFDEAGRLPPRWGRREVLDPIARLAHLGIAPATVWDQALGDGRGTPERRMAEIRASAAEPPNPFETAIELPSRLALSPAQDARWRTPRLWPSTGRPVPLWQASLDDDVSRGSLRAVWSADFRPDGFIRDTGSIGQLPPEATGRFFDSAISAADRHQLVTLSSVYGLPVVAHGGPRDLSEGDQIAVPPGYGLTGITDPTTSAIYLPRPLGVAEMSLSALGGSVSLDTHFEPPASVRRSDGSGELFPTLSIERWRQRSVLGRDVSVEIVYKGFLFPLGLRVSFVKSTERRFVRHPRGGPTAYLIQRLFLRVGRPRKTFPALGQADSGRAFPARVIDVLTRQTPDLINAADDPGGRCTAAGGGGPINVSDGEDGEITFARDGRSLAVRAFWPRTSRSVEGDVRFTLQIDETGGAVSLPMIFVDNRAANQPDVMAALVDYYNDPEREGRRRTLHHGTPRRYAAELKAGDATFETLDWVLEAEGQFGDPPADQTPAVPPPPPAPPADVRKRVPNRNFAFTAPLQGADQPPFYPRLDTCRIRLNQVGKFTGQRPPETTARYFESYVREGFPTKEKSAEVFLVTQWKDSEDPPMLRFGASGDRASGVGRPEHLIAALSRKNGPIGGPGQLDPRPANALVAPGAGAVVNVENPIPNFSQFDPKSFFGKNGKLLGIIDLGEVMRLAGGLVGMPELTETVERLSDQAWPTVCQTVLEPLKDVVVALDRSLAAVTGTGGVDQVKQLFGDVAAARDGLDGAVKMALAAKAPSFDQQAKLIGTVYERAQTFVHALEQLAEDPVGRIQVALRREVQGILDFAVSATSVVTTKLVAELRTKVAETLNDAKVGPLVIDAGPIVASLVSLPVEVNEAPLAAIRAVTSDLGAQYQASANLGDLPRYASGKIAEALRLAENSATVRADGALFAALAHRLETNPDAIEGILFDLVRPAVDDLTASVASVVEAATDTLSIQRAVALATLMTDAAKASTSLISALTPVAAERCGDVVGLVIAVRRTMATVPALVSDGLGAVEACIRDASTCAPGSLPAASIASRLLDGLDKVAKGQSGTWVVLRAAIGPPLDRIATLLGALLKAEADAPLPADDGAAAVVACKSFDFGPLVELVRPLQTGFAARRAMYEQIAAVVDAVSDAFKSLTAQPTMLDLAPTTLGLAKTACVGALIILRALSDLLPRPRALEAAVARVRLMLPNATPIVLPDPIPDLAMLLDDAVHDVTALQPTDLAHLKRTVGAVDLAVFSTAAGIEGRVLAATSKLAIGAIGVPPVIVASLSPAIAKVLGMVGEFYAAVEKARAAAQGSLETIAAKPGLDALFGPAIGRLRAALGNRFAVNDIDAAVKALETPLDVVTLGRSLDAAILQTQTDDALLETVGRSVAEVGGALLKGDIAQLIDIDAPRREIEALVRDLIPHKATMAYHLDTTLAPVGGIFIPDQERGGGRLSVDTIATIDLLATDKSPQTTVDGKLDPFNIHLFGDDFDVVLLKFKEARFGSRPGSPPSFSVDLESVELGEMVKFLKDLEDYLVPSDGNGFYLRPAAGSPGLEVGYGLNLGTITLPPVSFINVSLDASCRLPFDGGNALFSIGLSRPEAPFLISAGIYGGGGHLALIANGQKIVGFEASFEFGGVAAFSFGPLTGIGRLTTGIFVRKLGDVTTIDGFFFCGGSARIACFGISASLAVSISMVPGGAMAGRAVFSFSFSIGFAHIDFHVPVFKSQPALQKSASVDVEGPVRLAMLDCARPITIRRQSDPDGPRIHADTLSPERDWGRYRRYFARDLRPVDLT